MMNLSSSGKCAFCVLGLLILHVLFPHACTEARVVAFPGAEGFGAISKGGRGGKVFKVTNLNKSGPGSLQEACAAKGPRIVVFEVGGVIRGDVEIKHPRITIAGQTAPSPGITIEGRLLSRPEPWIRLQDIVVRFIRIRPGPSKGDQGDAVQLPDTERVILDHLSLSWANDETIDICHSSEFTIQWCTIEESDTEGHDKGRHNFGLISAYPNSGNISIHHNLFAHQSRRSPSLSPYVPGKPGDFRNNVVYNFRDGLTHDGHTPKAPINLINNYYKRGPDSIFIRPFEFHPSGIYHVSGNHIEGAGEVGDPRKAETILPLWVLVKNAGTVLSEPAKVSPVKTHSAEEAYRLVSEKAGCFPRDRVTVRSIQELMSGTGTWGRHAPEKPTDEWYFQGIKIDKAPIDSDGDGIPDDWESKHGLNTHDPSDAGRMMPSGYSAIEEYINDRAYLLMQGAAGMRQ